MAESSSQKTEKSDNKLIDDDTPTVESTLYSNTISASVNCFKVESGCSFFSKVDLTA